MTDLSSTLQIILQNAGYQTWLTSVERTAAVVCFEDMAAIGFASVFDDSASLLQNWRSVEFALLNRYARRLQLAEEKSWNIYSAFLTSAPGSDSETRQVRQIEEDLERTRKLAACGLVGHDEVVIAMLPLLPIQYRPQIENEDLTERLRKRISAIAPSVAEIALDEKFAPEEVARVLGAVK